MSTISPLRQRMIEDMNARKLHPLTQKGHIRSCKQFAAFCHIRGHPLVPAASGRERVSICLARRGPST
jgi:hypothetical protein